MLDPSKDLLVNVIKAADPLKYQAMVKKLQNARLASLKTKAIENTSFAKLEPISQNNNLYNSQIPRAMQVSSNIPYKKFEAVMLQNFIEKMFTSDTSDVFGKGQAGNIWRSMMSEAIGNEMAEAGGIGIAKMLEKQHKTQNQNVVAKASSFNSLQNLYSEDTLQTSNANLYSVTTKNS